MANYIYSKTTDKDLLSFYLVNKGNEYFLFTQKYYKGVKKYFHNKVFLNDALDFSKSYRDNALIRTKSKLLMYLKYIEKEYEIKILENTTKRKAKTRVNPFGGYELNFDSCECSCA